MGEAMFAIIAALGQLERDIIRERVNAGLDRARAAGVRLGRPPKEVEVERVLETYRATKSLREAARALNLSRTFVHRIVTTHRPKLDRQLETSEVQQVMDSAQNVIYPSKDGPKVGGMPQASAGEVTTKPATPAGQ